LSYKAVIGLGFGDEGKGLVVNALAHQAGNPLVARFNGGQQAGHTVTMADGRSHVFSNFGSGSFAGSHTYWSRRCSFDPVGFINELDVLQSKGVKPVLYLHRDTPVTTPYDKVANSLSVEDAIHGTCGVGVGKTFQREEDWYSLKAMDLQYPQVVDIKMKLISKYYGNEFAYSYKNVIEATMDSGAIRLVDELPRNDHYIFEGAQGLLLDQHNGFFPHVTRSNTGTENLKRIKNLELYCVTRAYQTRHGAGPMTNLTIRHHIKSYDLETNVTSQYQGAFRKSALDLTLLKYGIMRDGRIKSNPRRVLVITCIDQMNEYLYTIDGKLRSEDSAGTFGLVVASYLGFTKFILVNSPDQVELPEIRL